MRFGLLAGFVFINNRFVWSGNKADLAVLQQARYSEGLGGEFYYESETASLIGRDWGVEHLNRHLKIGLGCL
jgi:hypothetical protein